jgi:tetratricopeptide (TPR) repeat protein
MNKVESMTYHYDRNANGKPQTFSFRKTLLKEVRMAKLRRPDIVIDCATNVVKYETGNDFLNLQEQLFFAYVDVGQLDEAELCLEQLIKKFPKSARVRRLIGIMFECENNFKEANEMYDLLLTENPANLQVLKRKVCIMKSQGDIQGQIEALNKITNSFPMEVPTWVQLGEIYLSLCDYKPAAHCFEELVLLEPSNSSYHSRLAEVYYTIDGLEYAINARRHFLLSLEIQCAAINKRALYGLIMSCKKVAELSSGSSGSGSGMDAKVNSEFLSWAANEMEDVTSGDNGDIVKLVATSIMR